MMSRKADNSIFFQLIFLGAFTLACFIFFALVRPPSTQISPQNYQNPQNEVKGIVDTKPKEAVEVKETCVADSLKSTSCTACGKSTEVRFYANCSTYNKVVDDPNCTEMCPKCEKGKEVDRKCIGCNLAKVTKTNADCSTVDSEETDYSCSGSCPVYVAPTYTAPSNTGCCKVCTTGKACGDSCISRSYTCHKGPGCACDG